MASLKRPLYNWRVKSAVMDDSEAKRSRQLEDENAKLKKRLPEQTLNAAGATRAFVNNGRARRQARSRRAPAGRHGSVGAASLRPSALTAIF